MCIIDEYTVSITDHYIGNTRVSVLVYNTHVIYMCKSIILLSILICLDTQPISTQCPGNVQDMSISIFDCQMMLLYDFKHLCFEDNLYSLLINQL